MEYEYQSILLTTSKRLNKEDNNKLNDYFKQGWEYVDSISQSLSTPNKESGAVIVIFKRKSE